MGEYESRNLKALLDWVDRESITGLVTFTQVYEGSGLSFVEGLEAVRSLGWDIKHEGPAVDGVVVPG